MQNIEIFLLSVTHSKSDANFYLIEMEYKYSIRITSVYVFIFILTEYMIWKKTQSVRI